SDPGTLDTHTVVINWGDNSTPTTVSLGAGVLSRSEERRVGHDNPAGHPTGRYTISATVTDKDGGAGGATSAVEVDNGAPTNLSLTPGASKILENGSITLNGIPTDPGTLDTHTVVINWGDKSTPTTVSLGAGVLS